MCEGQDKNEINSQKRGFYIAGRYIGLSVSGRVQCLQRPNHSGGVGGLGLNTIVQQLFSLKRMTNNYIFTMIHFQTGPQYNCPTTLFFKKNDK